MDLIRIQQTVQQTLTKQFRPDGQLTDAAGDVTVTLKRLDGTVVASATATRTSLGTYTYPPPAQPLLDALTLDWSGSFGGAVITIRDFIEIVGGFYFGLDEVRAEHRDLRDTAKWTPEKLAQKRIEVEQECDQITGQAWVPRFARFLLDGSGTDELVVPDMVVRSVRTVSVAERAGGTFVALTADQLAAVAALDAGLLVRDDGEKWPAGHRNVIVEYEHGADMPPQTIRSAGVLRIRSKATATSSNIPDRAMSFTVAQGGVYRLSTPGATRTGIPDVDAAYQQTPLYGRRKVWLA